MHVLIVHHEAEYFAGAEKMLGYFLEGLQAAGQAVTVAAVRESRVPEVIPSTVKLCALPRNAKFSIRSFIGQLRALKASHQERRFDLIHGWAARDWELTALAGKSLNCPAMGTLHDHPHASFISRTRQRLMRWSAARGLQRVVCVSEAVRKACIDAGYPAGNLVTVRNGLPRRSASRTAGNGAMRLGYLGMFSQRKGLAGLFEILDRLEPQTRMPWRLAIAGDAQDEEGKRLVADIRQRFEGKAWWRQVEWLGWVKRPGEFLASLDLLICPSAEFDPFPTVLLEAGQAGLAVLAGRVGGVGEIVVDGQTGWLFEPQDWAGAAQRVQMLLGQPGLARAAGGEAQKRVEREFAIERMVAEYLKVYTGLANV